MDFDFGQSFGIPFVKSPFARLIPTLSGSQYGELATPIAFTGDFEIEVEFATTITSGFATLFSGVTDGDEVWAYVNGTTGQVVCRYGGSVFVTGTSTNANDGKLNKAKFRRVGTTVYTALNGGGEISNTYAATINITEIAIRASFGALIGQYSSIKFTDNGTVVANYVLDSGSDIYQLPRGESLGVELSGDVNCNNESYWDSTAGATFDGDGVDISYSGIAAALLQRLATSEPLTVGTNVLCEVRVSSYTSGSFDVKIGTTTYGTISAAGTFYFVGEVTVDGRIQLNATDFVGTIVELSYKQLPDNTCLLQNFATTDWYRYTQQRNILHGAGVVALGWVGDNKIVNGGFDADTDWNKGLGWSISGGKASNSGSVGSIVTSANVGNVAGIHLTRLEITDYTSGNLRLSNSFGISAGSNPDWNSTGIKATLINPSIDGVLDIYSAPFNGSIDNVSVQHLLEVAQ